MVMSLALRSVVKRQRNGNAKHWGTALQAKAEANPSCPAILRCNEVNGGIVK